MARELSKIPNVVVNLKTREELPNSKFIPRGEEWIRIIDKDYFMSILKDAEIIEDLKKHFHTRALYNTINFYNIDISKQREAGRKSISKSQKENNSNKVNWGKPHTIVDKEKLQELLNDKKSLIEICSILDISEFVLQSNIEYHKVSRSSDYARMPKGVKRSYYANILELERLFDIELSNDIIDRIYIGDKLRLMHDSLYRLRQTVLSLQRYNGAFTRSRSHGEMLFQNFLDNEGILYVNQFDIGKYSFDFLLIDYMTIVEIDGSLHIEETDKIKNEVVANEGLKLIRIKDTEFISKSKKICFNILRSKVLNQLESK